MRPFQITDARGEHGEIAFGSLVGPPSPPVIGDGVRKRGIGRAGKIEHPASIRTQLPFELACQAARCVRRRRESQAHRITGTAERPVILQQKAEFSTNGKNSVLQRKFNCFGLFPEEDRRFAFPGQTRECDCPAVNDHFASSETVFREPDRGKCEFACIRFGGKFEYATISEYASVAEIANLLKTAALRIRQRNFRLQDGVTAAPVELFLPKCRSVDTVKLPSRIEKRGRKSNSGRLQHSGCMNFPLRRICGGIAGGSGRDQQKGDCDFTNDKHRISSDFHRSITIGVITPERNVVVAFRNLSSAF